MAAQQNTTTKSFSLTEELLTFLLKPILEKHKKRMKIHLLPLSGAVAGHPKVAAPPPENLQTPPFSKIFT
jgi:hypothetical protein